MKYSKKIDLLKNRFKTSFKFVGFFMNDILLIIISTIILLIFLFTIRQSDLLYNIIKSILLLSFVVNISDLIGNLSSIISVVSGKTIDIRCIGKIDVGYLAFNKSIEIDQTSAQSRLDSEDLLSGVVDDECMVVPRDCIVSGDADVHGVGPAD